MFGKFKRIVSEQRVAGVCSQASRQVPIGDVLYYDVVSPLPSFVLHLVVKISVTSAGVFDNPTLPCSYTAASFTVRAVLHFKLRLKCS